MSNFTKSVVEEAALAWLEALGWQVKHGPDISPDDDTLTPALSQRERENCGEVVLFVNGLPLAVIELKNPADENATVWSAHRQLETYQTQIPAIFATKAALGVSDGVEARIGALGRPRSGSSLGAPSTAVRMRRPRCRSSR